MKGHGSNEPALLLLGDLVLNADKASSKNRSDSKDDQKDLENPHSSHQSIHEMQLGEEEKNSKQSHPVTIHDA